MNRDRVIGGLDRLQADGLAYVVCGANYLAVAMPHVPVGRSKSGSQVFACRLTCSVRQVADAGLEREGDPQTLADGYRPADGVR